jgi:endonuclease/exonuclease/phosphatase (EEP) superfamily protein YafD
MESDNEPSREPEQAREPRQRSRMARLLWPSWAERKRMLRRQAWALLVLCYAAAGFAYLWPADFRNASPAYVWTAWAAFIIRTFILPLGLCVTVLAALAAWRRFWRLLAAALPLAVFTIGPTCWEYRPRSKPKVVGETITVMSVNLLCVNRLTEPIVEEIAAVDPDVLLLQEYTPQWHQALQTTLGSEYPHVEYECREDSFDTAIYSKRPFEQPVDLWIPLGGGTEPQMKAVIHLAGRPVAFYNVHLLPPWGLDYIIESRTQFADLAEMLARERLPVVVGGDFNFTPDSPQAAALKRLGLRDAHSLGGWGRGMTWPNDSFLRWVPRIRLDHLYLGGGLTCVFCRTGLGEGSDHKPLIAEVGFAPR